MDPNFVVHVPDRRASTRTLMKSVAVVAAMATAARTSLGLGLLSLAMVFFCVALAPIWLVDRLEIRDYSSGVSEVWIFLANAWTLGMMIVAFGCYSWAVFLLFNLVG
jgi:hypothetical protein